MEQKDYYNQDDLWNFDYMDDSMNRERFEEIIEMIPEDVKSILDVGCGNGSFLNRLSTMNKFERLTGIDFSEEALKHVKTENVRGDSSDLPFSDKEFDAVVCLEVLEHLSFDEYEKTINEIRRVSRRYIIISVPNDQDLEESLVKCPACRCRFNPFFHKRSFNFISMAGLFPGAQNIITKEAGPAIRYRKLPRSLKVLSDAVRIRVQPAISYCPQCGYHSKSSIAKEPSVEEDRKYMLLKALFRVSRIFFGIHLKKRWILSLYKI